MERYIVLYISAKESDIESDGSAATEEVEEDGEED